MEDTDGNLYFQGQTINDTTHQDFWVIKTDANGCIDANDCPNYYVGIRDAVKTTANLTFYPNPSSETLNINFDENTSFNQLTKLQLHTVDGKTIIDMEVKFNNGKASVDVSNLTSGIYFVYLVQENKILSTNKIIIE